jgi:phenylalanyl-tRNA synthetase alpha chain
MDEKIIESLSPIERKVLPHVSGSVDEISKKSDTDKTTTLRALEFLKNKGLVKIETKEKKIVDLGINGIFYVKKKLPERRLIDYLIEKKSVPIGEIKNVGDLNENEAKISIGVLKRKALVDLKEGRVILTATEKEASKKTLEESLLEKLPAEVDKLQAEEKFALENLKSRKDIIELKDVKEISAELTKEGKEIASQDLASDKFIEQLTPKMISSESWKGKKFRRYDIVSPVSRIYGGKRHFVNEAVTYGKRIWTDMGFKEMNGPMADSSFWIFDALFTPQDHPAREMQDTFFPKSKATKLPPKNILEAVKKSHEEGVGGSKAWNYKWKNEETVKPALRSHTTSLSARTLASLKKTDLPAKYFALGKVFRNETIDWSHGFEFYQTEGIVVDPNANLRNLLGYLKEFYKKMGYEKIRFRPSFFAYTEPSVEIEVFHPERKIWVELGGAGIFRPEVTIPLLGSAIPVLAWGQGFDRIITEAYKIKDLREMYANDLKILREKPVWMK